MSEFRIDTPLGELTTRVARAQDLYRGDGPGPAEREAFLDAASRQESGRRGWWLWGLAGALVVTSVIAGVRYLGAPAASVALVGPARVEQGPGAWLAAVSRPLPVSLPDGSSVELGADARLRIVDLSPSAATLTLEMGLLRASVAEDAKGGPWRLDAGPFIVLAARAQFWVSWDPQLQLFEIALSQGSVSVEGPVLGESKLVESGHSLRVSVPDSLAVLTSLTDVEVPSAPEP